ncbi:MAG: 50S ribosomal protein L6 [Nanoarchaeota archaeon]
MKKELSQEIEIPLGVEVSIDKNVIKVKGKLGENKKEFQIGKAKIEKKDNKIIIECKKSSKKEKRLMNTTIKHIKNMIHGVQEKFEYTLKVCFSHFPMGVEVKENEAIVKNFLGEKISRKVQILPGAEVEIKKDIIIVKSINKEIAGQTAANFEKATIVPRKDRRTFQDGIFITNKAGREM